MGLMGQCSSTEPTVQSARKLMEEVDLSPSELWSALTTKTMVALLLTDGNSVIVMNTQYLEDEFAIVTTAAGTANLHKLDDDTVFVVIKKPEVGGSID